MRGFLGSLSDVANSLQDGFRIGISIAKNAPADSPTRRDQKTSQTYLKFFVEHWLTESERDDSRLQIRNSKSEARNNFK
jgi:hypothetical protein